MIAACDLDLKSRAVAWLQAGHLRASNSQNQLGEQHLIGLIGSCRAEDVSQTSASRGFYSIVP